MEPDADLAAYFQDGEFDYVVRIAPAAFPNLMAVDPIGPTGDFDSLIFDALVGLSAWGLSNWRDERWKVLVARRRRKVPKFVRIIGVDFVDTQTEAEARQTELRLGWVAGAHAADAAIKLRTIGKLRRSSQDG